MRGDVTRSREERADVGRSQRVNVQSEYVKLLKVKYLDIVNKKILFLDMSDNS